MLEYYKMMSKLVKVLINLLFVVQISLMILVFLTATYWFFNLIHMDYFSFVKPIADEVSYFVKMFYQQDVLIGGIYIDSSLLLFDLIAIAAVFGIAKLKYHLYKTIDNINISINKCVTQIEANFNKKLQREAESNIMKCKNAAILIQFAAKNLMVDSCWGGDANAGVAEKEEEAFKTFFASLKNVQGCKFAKTGDKMLILMNDFNRFDNVLSFVYVAVNRIKENMRRKHWGLFSYIAVDTFDDKADFQKDVYPCLEKLLTLKHQNEAVCLGNFCMRYNLVPDSAFTIFKKGRYNISGDCEVWALIKKN